MPVYAFLPLRGVTDKIRGQRPLVTEWGLLLATRS
jgi:hypothetical protein